MKVVSRLFWIALFVGVLVFGWRFAADHASPVTITLPFLAEIQITLWLALLFAVALGALGMGFLALYQLTRLRLLGRRYRKMIRGLESEVHQLRSLPLAEADSPAAQLGVVSDADPISQRALGRGA
jgi:hypothetical protein